MGEPTVSRYGTTSGDTCHIDVVDRWGNLVSATPSGGWLQSSPAIPGLGFCLGTRAQMFWLEEGLPASLAPGKRPRSTLQSTLVMKGEQPFMIVGSPGGDDQVFRTLQTLLNVVDFGMNVQEAIEAPRWATRSFPASPFPHTMYPGEISVEQRVPQPVRDGLTARPRPLSPKRSCHQLGKVFQPFQVVEIEPLQHHPLDTSVLQRAELICDLGRHAHDHTAAARLFERAAALGDLAPHRGVVSSKHQPRHHRSPYR